MPEQVAGQPHAAFRDAFRETGVTSSACISWPTCRDLSRALHVLPRLHLQPHCNESQYSAVSLVSAMYKARA